MESGCGAGVLSCASALVGVRRLNPPATASPSRTTNEITRAPTGPDISIPGCASPAPLRSRLVVSASTSNQRHNEPRPQGSGCFCTLASVYGVFVAGGGIEFERDGMQSERSAVWFVLRQ